MFIFIIVIFTILKQRSLINYYCFLINCRSFAIEMVKYLPKILQRRHLHLKPDFIKNKYNVTRGNFNYATAEHLQYFRNLLGHNGVITDTVDLEKYNVDWFRNLRGASGVVLKPKTTEHVSNILSFCNRNNLAVCVQGGNTGVAGGATPIFDEILLSIESMNRIIEIDEISGVLQCESGCILQNLQETVEAKNLAFPLDLGAKGSCQIGGNISTNAGGLRLLKFGNLHANILGLEIVLANGDILNCMNPMKKDNTGYHLKHLFIGAEGSLGCITKLAIQCHPLTKSTNLAFLGLQNFDKVLETFQRARNELHGILSAFEVIDYQSIDLLKHINLSSPIGDYPFFILLETLGYDKDNDRKRVEHFLEVCLIKHNILNGVATDEPAKIKNLWLLRERLPETFSYDGFVYMYDVSLPLQHYYRIVDLLRDYLKGRAHRIFGFGHLGDNNLHLQITCKEFDEDFKKIIDEFIYSKVQDFGGSISAEHGVGFLKAGYLAKCKTPIELQLMKNFKQLLDPKGILNPYKTVI